MQEWRALLHRYGLLVGLSTLGGVMLAVASPFSSIQRPETVARVNGQPISSNLFQEHLLQRGGQAILREMIYDHLLLQEAQRKGIAVSEAELQGEEKRLQQRFASEAEFESWKRGQARRWQDIVNTLRMQVLFRKLVEAEVRITDEEMADYYRDHREEFVEPQQVRAQGILVESRENAEALRLALEQPEADFAALAREFSLDPASKEQGGDLGWVRPGAYTEAIDKVLFSLQPGELSPPIETPDGFFLLRVTEAKPARQQELQEVQITIERRLREQKRAELQNNYLDRLRKQAQIEVLWPELEPLWDE